MSVLVEFLNVIVRRSAVACSYPGGVRQFEADVPNSTYCADEHLLRVGFMGWSDLHAFVQEITNHRGLRFSTDGESDICVVDQLCGPAMACDWLRFEAVDLSHACCWWAGDEPGDLAVPERRPAVRMCGAPGLTGPKVDSRQGHSETASVPDGDELEMPKASDSFYEAGGAMTSNAQELYEFLTSNTFWLTVAGLVVGSFMTGNWELPVYGGMFVFFAVFGAAMVELAVEAVRAAWRSWRK